MTVRNLDALFRPKSVAVIGASERPGSTGAMVWSRVLEGGFNGPLWPVNPKYEMLGGSAAERMGKDANNAQLLHLKGHLQELDNAAAAAAA
ncbi:MAG: CoA-binding protein, partial [Paraburkholderia fungorum]|nr:CoA-binding protein [Paraburkholderia fungorum]